MNQNVRVVTPASEEKFVFDTCCCCIPLRTGCLILGYLQLVAHIVGAIFAVLAIGAGVALNNAEEEKYRAAAKAVIIIGAVALVLVLIALPFTILLLCGLHKERRNYVKYYLIFAVVCLVLNVIVQVAKFSGGYGDSKEILSIILNIVLTIYFLLVLRSQYIKMGQNNTVPVQHYNPDAQLMNERRNYVKYYLIFAVVCLVLNVIVQVAKFSGGYGDSKEILSILLNIVLTIYFLLVLRSQYIKMGQNNTVPVQHYNPDAQLMNVQKV